MPRFERYIGVDYSGANRPHYRIPGLAIAIAHGADGAVRRVPPPTGKTWSRPMVHEWLDRELGRDGPALVGIDHGFGFPIASIPSGKREWGSFLDWFVNRWPTDEISVTQARRKRKPPGGPKEMRLTEQRCPGVKSVFRFGVQGEVATSTFAGLPWLRRLREDHGRGVHWWPFDGWDRRPGASLVAEVYPGILSGEARMDRDLDGHQRDANLVAAWLQELDRDDVLDWHLLPALDRQELEQARVEGWILGVR